MLFGSSMWPQSTPAGCEGRPRRKNRQDTGSTCRDWVTGTLQPRLRLRDMIPAIPEHIFLWVGRVVASLDFTFLRNGLLKSAFSSQGFIPTVFQSASKSRSTPGSGRHLSTCKHITGQIRFHSYKPGHGHQNISTCQDLDESHSSGMSASVEQIELFFITDPCCWCLQLWTHLVALPRKGCVNQLPCQSIYNEAKSLVWLVHSWMEEWRRDRW